MKLKKDSQLVPLGTARVAPARRRSLYAQPRSPFGLHARSASRGSSGAKLLRPSAGFTLIELLVVISIIGILAAFIVPNVMGAQDKAKEASIKSICHSVQLAVEAYHLENGIYPISSTIPLRSLIDNYLTAGGYMPSIPRNPFTGKAYAADDHAGKITYSYDDASGKYLITATKRNGVSEILQLSNI